MNVYFVRCESALTGGYSKGLSLNFFPALWNYYRCFCGSDHGYSSLYGCGCTQCSDDSGKTCGGDPNYNCGNYYYAGVTQLGEPMCSLRGTFVLRFIYTEWMWKRIFHFILIVVNNEHKIGLAMNPSGSEVVCFECLRFRLRLNLSVNGWAGFPLDLENLENESTPGKPVNIMEFWKI